MTTTYIHRDTASDLSGGGIFEHSLLTATAAGAAIPTGNIAKGASASGFVFTDAGVPGADGVTGDYSFEVNVTLGSSEIEVSVKLARVNSSGTVQVESAASAEQTATAGIKTFSFTALDLGAWASGDRLRAEIIFRSTATHGNVSCEITVNTTDAELVAPWSQATVVTVGLATETDSALPVGKAKTLAAGLAAETDTALAVSAAKLKAVGLASETNTAFAVGKAKAKTVGLAQETDTALAVSAGGEQIIAVGLASETDSAFAVTAAKQAAVGLAQETDSAFAIGKAKSLGIAQALEADTSLVLTAAKAKALGLASEIDTALAVSAAKARTVGLALETDTALDLLILEQAVIKKIYGSLTGTGKVGRV